MKSLIFLLVSTIFISCSEPKKFEDSYKETVLLQYLTTVNAPQETCESMITNKDLCFKAYADSIGATFSNTTASIKTKTCQDLLTNPLYKDMSGIAQTCAFDCQVTDWKTKTNSGICTKSTIPALIESSLTSSSAISCLKSCFASTNNQISNEKIPLYLLFNNIQHGE
ncbi:hypothetical protein ND861_00520 [Leptospira sp. 2 VSF19]|uniref:Lipoprotein n=1 Tax=Leptospira soteropolitanensis TaxID=2950025 RepID=A0AAW5V8G2_9LEPT|nr:hypothetical protein [Leptospira soteropolitanensis]MCW7491125.1 hypothetical protein [Leptospira soteropolitanensis]MCW7498709.1 hypothetical protein [Leptospira soteropolitanensis]MCW7521698.1 hypothetical protein [Leptospira soteropolitanensis]MCW7524813.1 hypothetical protein [Leptospira soteropolitanensis]MCW7528680.1 hypothetical protein [Leptospira soteropolitanensis]